MTNLKLEEENVKMLDSLVQPVMNLGTNGKLTRLIGAESAGQNERS